MNFNLNHVAILFFIMSLLSASINCEKSHSNDNDNQNIGRLLEESNTDSSNDLSDENLRNYLLAEYLIKRALPRMGKRYYVDENDLDDLTSEEIEDYIEKRALPRLGRALPRMGRALPRMGRAMPRLGRTLPRMG